jgi:hypothetical protein
MTAKTRAVKTAEPIVEELHFRSENAFLCLLLNRRTRSIRVIDFRAGALPAKRLFIQSVAQRENVQKVIMLVEKDEVSSWTRVGFVREGTVPGFYKRSDGHLVGCVIGDRTASIEVSDAGQRLAERTVTAARKHARDLNDPIRGVSVKPVAERTALNARDRVWRTGEDAYCSFDAFGRDASRFYVEVTTKKARANYLSAEHQDCFGHSLVEILRAPKGETDITSATAGLRALCETLKAKEIVSAFAFAPSDHVELATVFASSGFRKTGLLARGVLTGDRRTDAILWTRKLVDPSGLDGGDEDAAFADN